MQEKRLDRIEKLLDQMHVQMVKYNTLLDVHIEGVKGNRKNIAKIELELEKINEHITKVDSIKSFIFATIKYTGISVAILASTLGILSRLGVI